MKMFTKLIRLTMALLLLFAIVAVQAQNKKQMPAKDVGITTSHIVDGMNTNQKIEKAAVQSSNVLVPGKNTTPVESATSKFKPVQNQNNTDALFYSQMNPATWGRASQDFEASFDAYDNQAADDFVVSGGPWDINFVRFYGFWSAAGPADGFNIYFYADNAGAPGTLISSYPTVPYVEAAGLFLCELPTTFSASDGTTYWISIQADLDFAVGGQWYWQANLLPQIGYEGHWQNPGDGFGSGYTSWTAGSTVWGATYPDRDFTFEFFDVAPLPVISPLPYCQTVDGSFGAGVDENVTYEMYLYASQTYNFTLCDADLCCGGSYTGTGDGDFYLIEPVSGDTLWYIDGNPACNYNATTYGSAYEDWSPPVDGLYHLEISDYYEDAASFTLAYIRGGAMPLVIDETCGQEVGSFGAGGYTMYQINMDVTSSYNFSICSLDATCAGDYVSGGSDGDLTLYDNTGAVAFYIDGAVECNYNASTWGTAFQDFTPAYNGCYYLLVSDYGGFSGDYTLGHIKEACQVPCPGGSLQENEMQIANDATDVTNGGCNMLPNTPLFTPIASGDTYCGETNTYTTGGGTGEARDTDWYRFEALSSPGAYWNFDITVTAEFNSQLLLIDAGADDCTDYSIVTALTAGTCETINLIGDYPSGVYYIWVGPQAAAGNPYPYGTGPYNYVLSYTGTELGAPEATFSDLSFEKTVVPGGTDSDVLTIGNIGNYVLNYSAITTGTYNLVWEDMFDTYAAGVQLAVQSPDWTTWSGSPGSTEDPFVSNAFAFSGANSAEITGTVDAVREYGNLTSGSYRVSNMMYVVPGNVGYYNTLLTFDAVGAVYEWGMQVAFETDGTATLDAGVFAAATFAYTPGTWMLNEVYVDLDNDYAEYWFNGAFVHSWQWSIGTGGYTTNQLAANNFYAYTGAGGTDTPLFYIDDVKLEVAVLDWLTIDGGLGVSGSIADGGPDVNLNLAFDATGKAVGTYTKNITITTNELGAKTMSYSIPVTMYVGYKLTGNVYYGNTGTKSMAGNTTVTLTPGPTVNVGTLSEYEIRPLDNGNYLLTGATTKPGNNAQITTADGILTTRIAAGVGGPYSTLQFRAADVNASNGVTTSDAILVKRRAAGLTSPFAAPVFVFDGPFGPPNPVLVGKAVTINNGDATMELRCLLSGDVNSSHTP